MKIIAAIALSLILVCCARQEMEWQPTASVKQSFDQDKREAWLEAVKFSAPTDQSLAAAFDANARREGIYKLEMEARGWRLLPKVQPTTAGPSADAAGVEQLMASGQRQFNLQNYTGARDDFTRALGQNPQGDSRVEVLFWLAESYYKLNDLDNAKKNYTQVIAANAKHAMAWASVEQLANISLAQGEKDYPLVLLKLIVDKYPNYPEIARVKTAIARIKGGAGAGRPTLTARK